MFDLGPGTLTLILLLIVLVGVAGGFPVTLVLIGGTIFFLLVFIGPRTFPIVYLKLWEGINIFVLIAIPLFIYMGVVLERSGIADDLYSAMYKWFGVVPGGLAIGTIIICAIFAACTGIVGASVVTMGYVALPSMLKRGYDKDLAVGCVTGGGTLGVLIPPSVPLILIGLFGTTSIGGLFAAGVFSGLLVSALMIVFVLIRCGFNPNLGPTIPHGERTGWRDKLRSLKGLILPIILIVAVLGAIFTGAATPTEAASVGAVGSFVCVAMRRKLTWPLIKEVTIRAFGITTFIMWIVLGAYAFQAGFGMAGGATLANKALIGLAEVNRWLPVVISVSGIIILGTFMPAEIVVIITAPTLFPLIRLLGFSDIWFGILMVLSVMIGFLSPPFGYNLFYMKGILPDIDRSITMGMVYHSIVPYMVSLGLAVIIISIFPEIATWLPGILFGT